MRGRERAGEYSPTAVLLPKRLQQQGLGWLASTHMGWDSQDLGQHCRLAASALGGHWQPSCCVDACHPLSWALHAASTPVVATASVPSELPLSKFRRGETGRGVEACLGRTPGPRVALFLFLVNCYIFLQRGRTRWPSTLRVWSVQFLYFFISKRGNQNFLERWLHDQSDTWTHLHCLHHG